MSRLQQLGSSNEPFDGIEDAEFEEIDERPTAQAKSVPPPRPPDYTILEWWDDMHVLKKLTAVSALVFVALFAITILSGPTSPELNAAQSAKAAGYAVATEPAAAAVQDAVTQTSAGRYPVPQSCQAADKNQVVVCLRNLVSSKTGVLNQRIGNAVLQAPEAEGLALEAAAEKWNEIVDTICSTQADQFGPAGQADNAQEYWACLNKYVDAKLAEGSSASSTSFDPTKLRKGEAYANVRRTLLADGYRPAQYEQRDCSPYGTAPGEECYDRPEISYCSGTGQGFCSAYWIKGDAALSVVVAEGPSGAFEGADAITRSAVIAVVAQDGMRLVGE